MEDGVTSLIFKIKPSDPDFPFELAQLECDVRVPAAYPEQRPKLRVRNNDIPRGFGINIERGWDRLAEQRRNATLLAIIHALDRDLEKLLSEQKTETVKLIVFKDTRHLETRTTIKPETTGKPAETGPAPRRYVPEESYSKEQVAEARARRAQEVRQLEARMGRLPRFRRSADGIVFTLPLEPKRRSELPTGLRSVNSLHLIVPLMYPLQDLKIQLNEADGTDADPVEELFAKKAAEQKAMPLMSHLNYLAQNLHTLAKQAKELALQAEADKAARKAEEASSKAFEVDELSEASPAATNHVRVIARPPEWDFVEEEDDDDDDDYDDDNDNDDDDKLSTADRGSDEGDGGAPLGREVAEIWTMPRATETVEKGTMLSFPSIELYGIELLQVSLLSISVKCERCKTANDVTGLRGGIEKTTSCQKCATQLTAKFTATLVHERSPRAGFIDLSGCKAADLLPSTFIPTCGRCSTSGQGLVAVRGDTVTNVCRECHGKFTFKMPQAKFLFISPGSHVPPPTAGPRPRAEKLGLHAGEPLPDRGACPHYRKSFRWFRFSCCSRVHACDKCHDGAEDHVSEWAKRMICGWCSREQNYMVEACAFCGRSVIGNKGRGFWEGGKGTRDRTKMSRKDPRKYRRIRA